MRQAACLGFLVGCAAAQAAAVFGSSGLVAPAATITFDEQTFAPGHVLTNQYSADGLRFSPFLVYGLPVPSGNIPLMDGNLMRNFWPNGDMSTFTGTSPFALKFDDVQMRAAAAINMASGSGQAQALLNGTVVDSFSFTVDGSGGGSRFVGFEGLAFDEIRVFAPGPTQTVLLDTVQLGKASASLRNATGIANAVTTITFDEHVFPPGAVLTDQYADLGVRFSPYLVYGVPIGPIDFPPLDGAILRNFWPNQDTSGPFVGVEPFSILFDHDITAAAFAMNFISGQVATVSALLDGVEVRSFDVEAPAMDQDDFYLGFSGITFDEIRVDLPAAATTVLIDNIQIGPAAAVPEPHTLALTLLPAAWLWQRRRQRGGSLR